MKPTDEQLMLDMAALVRRTAWRLSTQSASATNRVDALHQSWENLASMLRSAWKEDDNERAA